VTSVVVRPVASTEDRAVAYAIRREVFVTEQAVPEELEHDAHDESAEHLLALVDGRPVGVGRLVVEDDGVGHLGRLAVRAEARGTGTGAALVRAIEARAVALGLRRVVLAAQLPALGFYQRLGYVAYGPEFDDAGIRHRMMARDLPGS
jgi:predicted GNAT family N-acyltransferase